MIPPVSGAAPGTDRALIERFLEMMAAEAGAARNTIAAYRSDLSLASDFLGHGLASASADDLVRLGAHWLELSRSSVARKSAALRRFFAFLHEEGFRTDDPGKALPRPSAGRTLPKVIGREPEARMIAAEAITRA